MDARAFAASLDALFVGDPADGVTVDPRFREIVASVDGFSTAAELAVLNLAARSIPPDEVYLEVGTFKGRSLCGAAVDSPTCSLYGIENFMEFGMTGVTARAELLASLATHADGTDLHLVEGDAFRLLKAGIVDRPVGVYFYDGVHTGEAHYLALALVEPLLADEAVVLIDDASWPMVERATRRYIDGRPGWSVLRTFDAPSNDDPAWANGLMVLEFRRVGPVAAMSTTDRARWAFQVAVRGPANALAWRTMQRYPGLIPFAKRAMPTGSRTVH